MRALVVVAAAAVLCSTATAGFYSPPGGDGVGQWLSNSTILVDGVDPQTGVFDGILTVDVAVSPPAEQLVAARGSAPRLSPNGLLLAFQRDTPAGRTLVVAGLDGSNQRTLFEDDAVPVGWLADSSRIVFRAPDYEYASAPLYSIRPDGSGLTAYPPSVHGVPSPDGSLFAFVPNSLPARVHVVTSAGTDETTIAAPADGGGEPVWSPDGSRLAFWSPSGASVQLAVARIGGGVREYPVGGSVNGSIIWSTGGRTISTASGAALATVDVVARTMTFRPWRSPLEANLVVFALSPDGTQIAFSAGGECRDRLGIYIAHNDGTDARRVTNSCRVIGTDGPDVLHGSFSQVVVGLGGDDALYADDTYYYFDGNTLLGGPGDDRLFGGYGQDTLYGGPGDDTLSGGPSKDILVGGPGHDQIDGGGGDDTIGARDGERDRISCGSGNDVVYADRVDLVARDCEIVDRR
jgi:hypothetical protein